MPVPAAAGPVLAALGVAAAAGGVPPVAAAAPAAALSGTGKAAGLSIAGFGTKPLGAIALSLLASGTLIGAAFSPPAAETLAAARRVIIVEGPATAAKGASAPPAVTAPPAPAPVVPLPLAQSPVQQHIPLPSPIPAPIPTPTPPPAPDGSVVGHSFVVLLPGDGGSDMLPRRSGPSSVSAESARATRGSRSRSAHEAESDAGGYLNQQLVPKGSLLANFQQVSASSIANRIAMVTGQPPNADTLAGCTGPLRQLAPADDYMPGAPLAPALSGCVFADSVANIYNSGVNQQGNELTAYVETGQKVGADGCPVPKVARGDTHADCWDSWAVANDGVRDLCKAPPKAGDTYVPPTDDGPDRRDNPLLWSELFTENGACSTRLRPLERLKYDIEIDAADKACATAPVPVGNANCLAQIDFVIPSRCRGGLAVRCPDGSAAGQAALDGFLKRTVSDEILGSAAFRRDGLLMLGFTGGDAPVDASVPGPKGLLLVSPFVKRGVTDPGSYSTYDLLYTLMSRANIADPDLGATMFGYADARRSESVPSPAREFAASNYNRKLSPLVHAG